MKKVIPSLIYGLSKFGPKSGHFLLHFYTNPSLFLAFTVFTSIVYFFWSFPFKPPLQKSKTLACGRVRLGLVSFAAHRPTSWIFSGGLKLCCRNNCRAIRTGMGGLLLCPGPKPKTKGPWAYNKILWATTMFSANIINLTCCIIVKMSAFRVDKFSVGRTKFRSPMLKRTLWNTLALFQIVNL